MVDLVYSHNLAPYLLGSFIGFKLLRTCIRYSRMRRICAFWTLGYGEYNMANVGLLLFKEEGLEENDRRGCLNHECTYGAEAPHHDWVDTRSRDASGYVPSTACFNDVALWEIPEALSINLIYAELHPISNLARQISSMTSLKYASFPTSQWQLSSRLQLDHIFKRSLALKSCLHKTKRPAADFA